MEEFDGYIELVEDHSTLFRDPTAPVPSPTVQTILPELLWHMDHHPNKDDGPNPGGSPPDNAEGTAISQVKVIERLLGTDSQQAETQTKPGDVCVADKGNYYDNESLPSSPELILPFLDDETEETDFCPRVHATDGSKKAGPAHQALIDLSNMGLANKQDTDPNLRLIKEMLLNSSEHPSWDSVHTESAEIKHLWSQYDNLKIQEDALLRRRQKQGPNDGWQIVALQSIRTICSRLAITIS